MIAVTTVTLLFCANFAGAITAAAINIAAWRMSTEPFRRRLFSSIALLALVYAVSYVWVLSNHTTVANWSYVMRWVALLAWALVWSAPAAARIWHANKLEDHIVQQTVDAVMASFSEPPKADT
jgi:type VI protein secretion system component VasK